MEHSIGANTLFLIAGFPFTNTMLACVLVSLLMIIVALIVRSKLSMDKPGKLQTIVELIVDYIYGLCLSIADKKRAQSFFPWMITFFLFIILNNVIGLFPGFGHIAYLNAEGHEIALLKGATSDLNLTFALGVVSFGLLEFYGFKMVGVKGWLKHYFHTKPIYILPIFIFVGVLELVLEPVKSLSLAFRLFGNVMAGETLVSAMSVINGTPILLAAVPFLLLEMLVAFVQALVFTLLTLTFISMITAPSEEH